MAKPFFDPLAETQIGVGVGVRQPSKGDVLVKEGGHQSCGIGQRCAAVENPVSPLEIEIALFPGAGHHHGGEEVVPIGIQHAAGIRRQLDGPQSALPGGLNPDGGLPAEHLRPLGQQSVRIVGIGGQRQHLPQLVQIPGMAAPQELTAQSAGAPKRQLLFHQPALGVHIFRKAHVQKAAVLLPQLLTAAALELILKPHGPSPLYLSFPARPQARTLCRLGSRNGVVRR